MDKFKAHFSGNKEFASGKGNNRLPQPMNDRKLYYSDYISMMKIKEQMSATTLASAGVAAALALLTVF